MTPGSLTGASATPQPFRNPDSIDKVARNQQESEKWDDLLAIIYSDQNYNDSFVYSTTGTWAGLRSVQVPCPVPVRLEYMAYWSYVVQGGSTLGISLGVVQAAIVGGQAGLPTPTFGQANNSNTTAAGVTESDSLFVCGTYDVDPGVYEVEAEIFLQGSGGVQLNNSGLVVRRGRVPIS